MHQLQHLVNPQKLWLGWQPQEGQKRNLHIVGELTAIDQNEIKLRYCVDSTDFKQAQQEGFSGYPAFKDLHREHQHGVLDALMRRLPPLDRGDFADYCQTLRIPADAGLSPFALLGYSTAKLPNDGFCVIHPFDTAKPPFEFITEVAGFRFYQEKLEPADYPVNKTIEFVKEPDNSFDKNAIAVISNGRCLGYVHRGHVPLFHRLLDQHTVHAVIERIHAHPKRPVMYLYVEVRVNG